MAHLMRAACFVTFPFGVPHTQIGMGEIVEIGAATMGSRAPERVLFILYETGQGADRGYLSLQK